MTSSPIPNAKAKFWNRAGQPLAGGKLYTYVAGSVNTNKATYKDYNNTMTNTNPVILDAYGEADIWLDGIYKLYLTDANDVAQWATPIDSVSSINTTNTTYTTTGSGNAYILTPSPAITSYVGSSFTIIPNFTNTAPATININGLGVINLRKNGSSVLVANDLILGQFYTIAYDGANFQVTNLNSNFTSLTVTGLTTLADVKINDSINDTNNNEVVKVGSTTSAVNEITVTNAATGSGATIAATGDDSTIPLNLVSKNGAPINANGSPLFTIVPKQIIISNNVTDANNDIDFTAGNFPFSDGTGIAALAARTKQLDATWVAGTNQGGLDTGSKANNTWYHCYAIYNPTTFVSDAIFSTSATSPTLPSGYTKFKRVSSILTNASGNILAFTQNRNEFLFNSPIQDVNATNQGTSAVSRTLSTPLGVKTLANISVFATRSGTGSVMLYNSLDQADVAVVGGTTAASLTMGANVLDQCFNGYVMTDTSSRIRTRWSASDANINNKIVTMGWQDITL